MPPNPYEPPKTECKPARFESERWRYKLTKGDRAFLGCCGVLALAVASLIVWWILARPLI